MEDQNVAQESQEQKLYVGQKEVESHVVHENLDQVGVLYTDQSCEDFTNEQWFAVSSNEPYDQGLVTIRKFTPTIRAILGQLMAARCTLNECQWVLQRTDEEIGRKHRDAISKLYGVPHVDKVMLSDVHAVLTRDIVETTPDQGAKATS